MSETDMPTRKTKGAGARGGANGKPAVKTPPVRETWWRWRSGCGLFGVLCIRSAGEDTDYLVQVESANCVLLTKTEGPGRRTVYTVFFGKSAFCGCPAWERAPEDREGKKTCKHVEALTALRANGKI